MQTYNQWVDSEAARIVSEMHRDAMSGDFSKSLFFIPASGGEFAKLALAHEMPEGGTDVIRFLSYGTWTSRIAAVPYGSMPSGIREACRRLPVFPVPAST